MGLSKSSRILILLAIDSAFFLLELIVGYAVHSLALVADSFHMLNDVLSLCVGLWAVKVANERTSSKTYTYGWQRAETLGALVNGVFLVALCLSIFLEAIQRFVEPQTVSNPRLVLIVGCFGLVSNILGLFLFHDHGHSHGGASDGHTHDHDSLHAAEEGRGHHTPFSVPDEDSQVADESGNIADVLPQNRIGGGPRTNISGESTVKVNRTRPRGFSRSDEDDSTAAGTSPAPTYASASVNGSRRHRRHTSSSRSRGFSSVDDIHIHPASLRNEIIAAGRLEDIESATGTESECEESVKSQDEEAIEATEGSPLLGSTKKTAASKLRRASMLSTHSHHSHHSHNRGSKHGSWHIGHKHNAPKEESSPGGHSHHDLNMRGVFLHVMGDALGNIGVIGSALIIWLTPYWWRFYSDPLISLVITVIILASAIPLCKAASRILLQAAPAGISVDDIKEDIEELPGIFSCHHLHVWQLSDTKLVASLHVQVEFDFKGEGSARYMELAQAIRTCLHDYGIRSSTIQPEFCLNSEHDHTASGSPSNSIDAAPGYLSIDGHQSKSASKHASREGSVKANACLLECGGDCADGSQCCAPGRSEDGDHSDHGHNHSH